MVARQLLSITKWYRCLNVMHIKREVVSVSLGSGGSVNQKIEEKLVTLPKFVTICYKDGNNMLEKILQTLLKVKFSLGLCLYWRPLNF